MHVSPLLLESLTASFLFGSDGIQLFRYTQVLYLSIIVFKFRFTYFTFFASILLIHYMLEADIVLFTPVYLFANFGYKQHIFKLY